MFCRQFSRHSGVSGNINRQQRGTIFCDDLTFSEILHGQGKLRMADDSICIAPPPWGREGSQLSAVIV